MYGKLRNRRRADRCEPSEFVALTTASRGISRSALSVTRSCVETCDAYASYRCPPGNLRQMGAVPST
jgi:hypothetical protein